jgi:hypothetical protein
VLDRLAHDQVIDIIASIKNKFSRKDVLWRVRESTFIYFMTSVSSYQLGFLVG